MKKVLFAAALALFATTAAAQTVVTTGPVTTSDRVSWTLPDTVPLSDYATFEYRLRDGSFIPVTALTNVQCVAGTPVVCTASLTQANVDALNMIGIHSLTLSMFRADVGDSPQSLPFTLRSPAPAPINLRIIR